MDSRHELRYGKHQIVVYFLLQRQNLLLGAQNLLLVFLQFGRDVTLGVHQRLLANPLLGHAVFVGVAYLDVVAENVVETDFERRNARQFALTLLNFNQIIFARISNVAQLVEFGVHTVVHHAAFGHLHGRVGLNLTLDALTNRRARIQLFANGLQRLHTRLGANPFHGHDGFQSVFQRQNLARVDAPERHLADEPLKVAHVLHFGLNRQLNVNILNKICCNILAFADGQHVFQRQRHPAFQHSRAHWRERVVDDVDKAVAVVVQRTENLKVTERETVNPHVLVLGNAADARDVANLRMLRNVEIVKY